MTYTLTFINGESINGFRWSALGWYHREFPFSGIGNPGLNILRFTKSAIRDQRILVTEEAA